MCPVPTVFLHRYRAVQYNSISLSLTRPGPQSVTSGLSDGRDTGSDLGKVTRSGIFAHAMPTSGERPCRVHKRRLHCRQGEGGRAVPPGDCKCSTVLCPRASSSLSLFSLSLHLSLSLWVLSSGCSRASGSLELRFLEFMGESSYGDGGVETDELLSVPTALCFLQWRCKRRCCARPPPPKPCCRG